MRVAGLAFWAADGGPLTLTDASGSVHLALFERPARPCRSTVALRFSGDEVSLYFSDPDGNPHEITTYDTAVVGARR